MTRLSTLCVPQQNCPESAPDYISNNIFIDYIVRACKGQALVTMYSTIIPAMLIRERANKNNEQIKIDENENTNNCFKCEGSELLWKSMLD